MVLTAILGSKLLFEQIICTESDSRVGSLAQQTGRQAGVQSEHTLVTSDIDHGANHSLLACTLGCLETHLGQIKRMRDQCSRT